MHCAARQRAASPTGGVTLQCGMSLASKFLISLDAQVSRTTLDSYVKLTLHGGIWYNTCMEPQKALQFSPTPLPSSGSIPVIKHTTPLTPLVADERAIGHLLGLLMSRSGLSTNEVARRLGVTPNSVRQYLKGRRCKPSLIWFIKLVEVCGGRVNLETPERR